MSDANPWPTIPFWEDPPSRGLQPFADDSEMIREALALLERELSYRAGAPLVSDRAVTATRLDQIRDLIARLGF